MKSRECNKDKGVQQVGEGNERAGVADATYLAAPAARSASSGRLCPVGVCDFFVSCTGCTLWLCLGFELETPVWQTAVSDTCRNYSNDASPQGFKVTFLKKKKTKHTQSCKTRAISASAPNYHRYSSCHISSPDAKCVPPSSRLVKHTCCKFNWRCFLTNSQLLHP